MAFRDLPKRTASDKVFHGKAFNTAKNQKYDGYKRGLASMVSKCFNKKHDGVSSGSGVKVKNMSNQLLGKESHRPIV